MRKYLVVFHVKLNGRWKPYLRQTVYDPTYADFLAGLLTKREGFPVRTGQVILYA
jgi:hypothetical protein